MAQQTTHDDPVNPSPEEPKAVELKAAVLPTELKANELSGKPLVTSDELLQFAATGNDSQLLGQERALDAIRLAIGIDALGYNVFATGLRSRAERDSILRLLQTKAATMPTPGDWVYVNNFRSPETPTAIYLLPGQGVELRRRMRELVDFIVDQLPKAFRREDFDRNALLCVTNTISARRICTANSSRSLVSVALRSRAPRPAADLYSPARGQAAGVTRRTHP